MTLVLNAEHVRVEYGKFVAVSDVHLQIEGGQLVGLVGPNGAGKTSLFRGLAGLHALAAGRVRVLDEDVVPGNIAALGSIGFAPDTPPVYDTLTVDTFLHYIGRAYGLQRGIIDERIDYWLEQLWLSDKRRAKLTALSRGMRQRLTIARTLLPDPPFILLDEPSAGLDPAGRVQFRQLLTSLREQGKALIVSSHILADLHEYCTHIAIIERGTIRQYDTVRGFVDGATSDRCRYRMALVKPIADAERTLRAIDGVHQLRIDGRVIMFEYHDDPEQAAALLADLIARGLPVAGFSAVELNLEEAYLRTGVRQVD
jgi:ABC-2 type transport system ATP-binding protein